MDTDELSRRFDHHPPRDADTIEAHERVRYECRRLAERIAEHTPPGREQALALTNVEQAMFWANAAIARQ